VSTIYLNNAATSYPKSRAVLDAYVESASTQPDGPRHGGRSELPYSEVATLLGVPEASLHFVPSATIGINIVLRGALRARDHVVVDRASHNSVLRVLADMPVRLTATRLHLRPVDEQESALLSALKPSTRLVCLNHVSNVVGTALPLERLIILIRRVAARALVFVDASQSIGVVPLATVGSADFVVLSGHKHLHALPGSAVLIARAPLLPWLRGGTGTESTKLHGPFYDDQGRPPLCPGTPDIPAAAALAAGLRETYADYESSHRAQLALVTRLRRALRRCPQLELLSPPADMLAAPIVACHTRTGNLESEWVPLLRASSVVTRGGLHCAPWIHDDLGVSGSLRLSLSRFTTEAQVDAAAEACMEVGRVLASI